MWLRVISVGLVVLVTSKHHALAAFPHELTSTYYLEDAEQPTGTLAYADPVDSWPFETEERDRHVSRRKAVGYFALAFIISAALLAFVKFRSLDQEKFPILASMKGDRDRPTEGGSVKQQVRARDRGIAKATSESDRLMSFFLTKAYNQLEALQLAKKDAAVLIPEERKQVYSARRTLQALIDEALNASQLKENIKSEYLKLKQQYLSYFSSSSSTEDLLTEASSIREVLDELQKAYADIKKKHKACIQNLSLLVWSPDQDVLQLRLWASFHTDFRCLTANAAAALAAARCVAYGCPPKLQITPHDKANLSALIQSKRGILDGLKASLHRSGRTENSMELLFMSADEAITEAESLSTLLQRVNMDFEAVVLQESAESLAAVLMATYEDVAQHKGTAV